MQQIYNKEKDSKDSTSKSYNVDEKNYARINESQDKNKGETERFVQNNVREEGSFYQGDEFEPNARLNPNFYGFNEKQYNPMGMENTSNSFESEKEAGTHFMGEKGGDSTFGGIDYISEPAPSNIQFNFNSEGMPYNNEGMPYNSEGLQMKGSTNNYIYDIHQKNDVTDIHHQTDIHQNDIHQKNDIHQNSNLSNNYNNYSYLHFSPGTHAPIVPNTPIYNNSYPESTLFPPFDPNSMYSPYYNQPSHQITRQRIPKNKNKRKSLDLSQAQPKENSAQVTTSFSELDPDLYDFLGNGPKDISAVSPIKKYVLKNGDVLHCIYNNNHYYITGTDIVKLILWKFSAANISINSLKKLEEGVFSDLMNLKPGVDATLENPRSVFLEFLYKHGCIRTQKKQKVFYWYSVAHDTLFNDAVEREMRRDTINYEQEKANARFYEEFHMNNNFGMPPFQHMEYFQPPQHMQPPHMQPPHMNPHMNLQVQPHMNQHMNSPVNPHMPPHINSPVNQPAHNIIHKSQIHKSQSYRTKNPFIKRVSEMSEEEKRKELEKLKPLENLNFFSWFEKNDDEIDKKHEFEKEDIFEGNGFMGNNLQKY